MCFNSFKHNSSTLKGFNGLCTKAHGKVLHLNKRKKLAKESAKIGNVMAARCISKLAPSHLEQDLPRYRGNRIQMTIIYPI